MRKLHNMLMIGSAGANVGKTELACAIIRRFCKSNPLIGIKVTTIQAKDGQCPRGGVGCGVCRSGILAAGHQGASGRGIGIVA
jgi:hypothetical protein